MKIKYVYRGRYEDGRIAEILLFTRLSDDGFSKVHTWIPTPPVIPGLGPGCEDWEAVMNIEEARGIAAQCWCTAETENIDMDPRLAEAFAWKLVEVTRKPTMGQVWGDYCDWVRREREKDRSRRLHHPDENA